jgi:hypothetical protein
VLFPFKKLASRLQPFALEIWSIIVLKIIPIGAVDSSTTRQTRGGALDNKENAEKGTEAEATGAGSKKPYKEWTTNISKHRSVQAIMELDMADFSPYEAIRFNLVPDKSILVYRVKGVLVFTQASPPEGECTASEAKDWINSLHPVSESKEIVAKKMMKKFDLRHLIR